VEFVERKVSKESISKRKLVCGVGINDADYVVQPMINRKRVWCPYFLQWKNLIEGNYGKRAVASGDDYEVYRPWIRFSVFREWMKRQDWKDKSLDKDIILPGNKTYGPDVCAFVTHRVNDLMTPCKSRRLPRGVHRKSAGVYYAGVAYHEDSGYVKSKSVRFNTIREASEYWLDYKEHTVIEVCTTLTDSRVIKGLMLHMKLIREESLKCVLIIEAEGL